ncbi:MAG: hypothetical protein ACFFEN_06385 [Candidatus Thorarchaeota archaeon]
MFEELLTSALPDTQADKLEDIILIYEAHQIAERFITTNPDDYDFISREQLEKMLNTLIREFRSKGLLLIIADPNPHHLFNSVLTIHSLKILFMLSQLDYKLYINNLELQEYLTHLKQCCATALNGYNEENFTIETLDYLVE